MNDELLLKSPRTKNRRRLEERLAQRPELLERLHEIVDTLEESVADGCDAHASRAGCWKTKATRFLRVLISHVEPEDQKEAPVRTAHRYLSDRTNQLDYAGARAAGLPGQKDAEQKTWLGRKMAGKKMESVCI